MKIRHPYDFKKIWSGFLCTFPFNLSFGFVSSSLIVILNTSNANANAALCRQINSVHDYKRVLH